jgi:hypothetical protein
MHAAALPCHSYILFFKCWHKQCWHNPTSTPHSSWCLLAALTVQSPYRVTYLCPKGGSPWAPGSFDLTLEGTTESPTCGTISTTDTARVVVTDKPQVTVVPANPLPFFCDQGAGDVDVAFLVQVTKDSNNQFELDLPMFISTSDGRTCTRQQDATRGECAAVGKPDGANFFNMTHPQHWQSVASHRCATQSCNVQ